MRSFFEKRYLEIGGKIVNVKLKPSLRINTLRINDDFVVERLRARGVFLEEVFIGDSGTKQSGTKQRIPHAIPHAFYYKSNFSLSSTPEFLLGLFHLQEVASMIPPLVLEPKPDDLVLDMAASPGSKTSQLSALMNNSGVIVALEKNKSRVDALKFNLQRLGCRNVVVLNVDALDFKPCVLFDRILLDAPCSGNYAQNILQGKDINEWFNNRTLSGILRNSSLQKTLIKKAFSLLKDGGVLVYSTCSLEPEENEAVVDYALSIGFDIEPLKLGFNSPSLDFLSFGSPGITRFFDYEFNPKVKHSLRFWPFKEHTQGFFIAKLVKRKKSGEKED